MLYILYSVHMLLTLLYTVLWILAIYGSVSLLLYSMNNEVPPTSVRKESEHSRSKDK